MDRSLQKHQQGSPSLPMETTPRVTPCKDGRSECGSASTPASEHAQHDLRHFHSVGRHKTVARFTHFHSVGRYQRSHNP